MSSEGIGAVTDAMVEAAYDAFTRSFNSKPIGTNNTRDDLRAALATAFVDKDAEIAALRMALNVRNERLMAANDKLDAVAQAFEAFRRSPIGHLSGRALAAFAKVDAALAKNVEG